MTMEANGWGGQSLHEADPAESTHQKNMGKMGKNPNPTVMKSSIFWRAPVCSTAVVHVGLPWGLRTGGSVQQVSVYVAYLTECYITDGVGWRGVTTSTS